jgi:hypothetical protein
MTLKTKLVVGMVFLFLIIFSVVAVCTYYVGRLGEESSGILKDNYASIVYARNMLAGLDDMKNSLMSTRYEDNRTAAMSGYYVRLFDVGNKLFDTNLKGENGNITEIHEKETVDALNQDYGSFIKLSQQIKREQSQKTADLESLLAASDRVKRSVNSIYDMNMHAVVLKSQMVKKDSSRFINSMAIIGSICVVLAIGYLWYFPVYVSTSLSYLAERMRQLLKKAGIESDGCTKDETFTLLHGIELLENKLTMKT